MKLSYQDRHRELLRPVANLLVKLKVSPNFITVISFVITSLGVIWIVLEKPLIAALWFSITSPMDALDGFVARISNSTSKFGAFLDSTFDRITDGMIFLSLIYTLRANNLGFVIASVCLILTYLISYTKARVEGLGGSMNEGLMSRYPRIVLMILILILWGFFGKSLLVPALCIYAFLLFITFIQRFILAYDRLKHL